MDLNLPTKKDFTKSLNINCQIEPIKYNGIEDDGMNDMFTNEEPDIHLKPKNNNDTKKSMKPKAMDVKK